ncbi:MAG: hypothetical protein IPJ38_15125 [Dechloromonas sp.]|uniref:Uncharacterized protein n=1 Tax=Candidatus Dechloromonas phosphorivorans TaxID=2899244 RepID=A0A935JZL6_9RHOO|nr:hypothetical protein [Candidatus Dechloromonas phosphorivorans]
MVYQELYCQNLIVVPIETGNNRLANDSYLCFPLFTLAVFAQDMESLSKRACANSLGQWESRNTELLPCAWFPFKNKAFGEYALHAAVPKNEIRNGIQISHPRYLLLPKLV